MAAPPFLELDEARPLGIDLGPEVVVLGPQGVGRIQVLEILDQHAAIELAVAEVAGERGHPAAAGQAAGVAHRVLAFHAGPVGQRRAGHDDRAEQFGPDRRHQQHGPAALAVADDAGLAFGVGVQCDDLLEEHRLGVHDVFDGLARHRLGREADEVGGVAGTHRHAELAVGLEAADSRPVPGARIDHHERALQRIDRHPGRRIDAHQQVVDRPFEGAAVQHQLGVEPQHVRHRLVLLRVVLVAALPHHVPEQHGALHRIGHVLADRTPGLQGGVLRPTSQPSTALCHRWLP